MGILVIPHAFPILPVYFTLAVSTMPICGPPGSIATMPATSLGRSSATLKPMPPPCECVIRITGLPIWSSSATPAGTASSACAETNCIWPLMKLSKTGSPIVPFFGESLGHCVYLLHPREIPAG